MNSVLKWVGATAVLALAGSVPAVAQGVTEPLSYLGTAFSVPSSGGWSVTLTSCQYTNSAVTANATGNCGTENVAASVSGSQLSLVFEGTNGPQSNDFLYNAGLGSGDQTDLTIELTVTAPGGQEIYAASETLASASTPSAASQVSAGESFSTPAETAMSVSLGSVLTKSENFAPLTKAVSVTNDINANAQNGVVVSSIPTLTMTFNAPEPVSSSLLAVGIAGLGFVRRKIRRPV